MDQIEQLLEQTIRAYVCPEAHVMRFDTRPMGQDERGYSGAQLRRHTVTFRTSEGDATTTTLVTKEAALVERRVLDLLTSQDQCVPFSHALDLVSDHPALVCQQDLGGNSSPQPPFAQLEHQAARCLARIHYTNLGRAPELAWLPRADRAYVEGDILADYRTQVARAKERPAFTSQLGSVARKMEEAISPFLDAMDMLWQEESSLTLIHADMMDAHILVHDDRPYIIDWNQARYGSFYLDLPNYFTPGGALSYRNALAELGLVIPEDEFMHRYREAGRYAGFKYIGFLLSLWSTGQIDSLQGSLLDQLLLGKV